jgi:hypothetical protein
MSIDLISSYLADPSVPKEVRKDIAAKLNSGAMSQAQAVKGITAKYGEKYGKPQAVSGTPQEKLGGAIAKKVVGLARGDLGMGLAEKAPEIAKGLAGIGRGLTEADKEGFRAQQAQLHKEKAIKDSEESEIIQSLNKMSIVPDSEKSLEEKKQQLAALKFATPITTMQDEVGKFTGGVAENIFKGSQSGLLTGAEGVQKVGAAITGNTDQLEGFRSFYGLKSKEQAAADMRTLAPAERGQMFGEGAQNFVSGTVGAAFSPIVGATEALPYGKEALGLVGEGLGAVSQAGSGQFKNLLKNSGIQLSPEQEASIDEGVGNLLNLFLVKAGEDVAKVKATEAVKMKVQTQVPELIKKGDFAGAKALLAEYEAANLAKTTATGRVGAVAGEAAGAAATAGARMAGELVKKTAEASGRALKSTGEGIGKVGEGIQSKVSGLDIETINTLKNLPDEFKTAAKEGVEGARTNAFNQIKNVVDELIADLRSTGKAYETFGEATINVGSFLDDSLRKAGLVIDESGKITTSPSSAIRSAGEINKIQALRDLYKDKEVMTGKEFLNLRSDLGELAKYNQETTPGARLWAKQTRAELNKGFRNQVEGLKEADVANSAIRKDLLAIKGMIYDKAGNIKSDAISKVNNLFNKGKEQQLAVLEKIIPDFGKFKSQVKVTKALEDVERASGVKVGTYANGILAGGGGAMVGGPVGAVVGMILTNPKVVAGLLLKYGELKKMSKGVIESITNKITGGKDLTKTEAALTGDMIQHFAKQDTAVPTASASGGVATDFKQMFPQKKAEVTTEVMKNYLTEIGKNKPRFIEITEDLASSVGGKYVERTKTAESIITKMDRRPENFTLADIGDAHGSTVLTKKPLDVMKLAIEKYGVDKKKINNFQETPTWLGYNEAIHMDVKMPNGQITEIQINSPAGLLRKEFAHPIYEKWRKYIEGNDKSLKEAMDAVPAELHTEFLRDVAKSIDIFNGKVKIPAALIKEKAAQIKTPKKAFDNAKSKGYDVDVNKQTKGGKTKTTLSNNKKTWKK